MTQDQVVIGAKVRAINPDDYIQDIARKLRNRVGVIERIQMFSKLPIVTFPKEGRRKEFKWVPQLHAVEVVE